MLAALRSVFGGGPVAQSPAAAESEELVAARSIIHAIRTRLQSLTPEELAAATPANFFVLTYDEDGTKRSEQGRCSVVESLRYLSRGDVLAQVAGHSRQTGLPRGVDIGLANGLGLMHAEVHYAAPDGRRWEMNLYPCGECACVALLPTDDGPSSA